MFYVYESRKIVALIKGREISLHVVALIKKWAVYKARCFKVNKSVIF